MNESIKMKPEEWVEVCRLCEILKIDPYNFSQMRNGGKLIFDLIWLEMFPSNWDEFSERYKCGKIK